MEGIRPQAGAQERFLSSSADIAIYGEAAGGGKSFALLMEPLRHIGNEHFGGVIFRRTSPQITNEGALWDEAGKLYPLVGGDARVGSLEYKFPSGSSVSFRHLQYEATKHDWQGAQVAFIGFDELTHFTKLQFFYMLSRNRSTCCVRQLGAAQVPAHVGDNAPAERHAHAALAELYWPQRHANPEPLSCED